jgi:UDP-N-acetylmuramate--alanine ligase
MFVNRVRQIHFVGIGGIGMSGIAEVLLNLGYDVSGSDLKASDTTDRLAGLGGRIFAGHDASQVEGADVVVVSSAITEDNPEVAEARRLAIPVIPRAEMLAELMRLKYGVAVAGTHGKTTTTSLVATVLQEAGLDPTIVIGGKLNSLGSNARLGQSDYMVVEADESDGSFLKLSPVITVLTNIDAEHLNHYGSMKELEAAFLEFANKVPFYGAAVVCLDHPRVQALLPKLQKRYLTYGLSAQADYRARDVHFQGLESSFEVVRSGEPLGRVEVKMPGAHNVLNALSVVAVADELGIEFGVVRDALRTFQGIQRRFSIRGEAAGVVVVDDYGHHPAEIMTTLQGARRSYPDRRIVAVFQPHRYSRIQRLWEEFSTAFNQADLVVVTDVYAANEKPRPGVSGQTMADSIRRCGHKGVSFTGDLESTVALLADQVSGRDLVITLGAGDVWRVGQELVERLERRDGPISK